MSMAAVVLVKGTSGRYSVLKILEFMEECGDAATDIIVKTDQEPAITVLMKDLVDETAMQKERGP